MVANIIDIFLYRMVLLLTVIKGLFLSNNSYISADYNNQSEIRELVKSKKIVCPDCRKHLIFKSGEIKIPHFAHFDFCSYPYHEHETDEHLIGKVLIKNLLNITYPASEILVEERIEVTKQRPDVLIKHPDGSIWVFEMQCTNISGSEWWQRHKLYEKAGIKDFWILGKSLDKIPEKKYNFEDFYLI